MAFYKGFGKRVDCSVKDNDNVEWEIYTEDA